MPVKFADEEAVMRSPVVEVLLSARSVLKPEKSLDPKRSESVGSVP